MNRRRKRWLLRNAKMLAVCGAMVYLATGLTELRSNAGGMKAPPEATIATAVSEAPMIELNEEEPKETQKQSLVASRAMDSRIR